MAAVTFALQQSGGFELLQHAVQRRLGQAGFLHQALQRMALVTRSQHLEQRKQAQRGSVAAGFGNCVVWVLNDFHLP